MDNAKISTEQLRQQITTGKVSCEDVVKRLTIAIEKEYLKDCPDVEFIDTCEDFLWEVGTLGQQGYVSANGQYAAAINRHIEQHKLSVRIARRCAIVFAVFALFFVLSQGVFRLDWFSQSSSPDEQQYIIQGHSIDIPLIAQSIAEHQDIVSIQTSDWNEYVEFLGFVPTIIEPSVFNATEMQYIAFFDADLIELVIHYNPTSDHPTVLLINHFLNAEETRMAFEQDAQGNHYVLEGIEVYNSTNAGKVLNSWMIDHTLYALSGEMDQEQCHEIVQTLIKDTLK